MTSFPSKHQPLLDRQLISRNLIIYGGCISYAANEQNDVGLFVSTENEGQNYEIEVLSLTKSDSIAIGVVPSNYQDNILSGLGHDSLGYHSDGKSAPQKTSGQAWKVGDRIGCKIVEFGDRDYWKVKFTQNGKEIGGEFISGHLFAVGMKAVGDKVKVVLSDE